MHMLTDTLSTDQNMEFFHSHFNFQVDPDKESVSNEARGVSMSFPSFLYIITFIKNLQIVLYLL